MSIIADKRLRGEAAHFNINSLFHSQECRSQQSPCVHQIHDQHYPKYLGISVNFLPVFPWFAHKSQPDPIGAIRAADDRTPQRRR